MSKKTTCFALSFIWGTLFPFPFAHIIYSLTRNRAEFRFTRTSSSKHQLSRTVVTLIKLDKTFVAKRLNACIIPPPVAKVPQNPVVDSQNKRQRRESLTASKLFYGLPFLPSRYSPSLLMQRGTRTYR